MLNEILREKRKELDLTQQHVADHLNVTRQTVSIIFRLYVKGRCQSYGKNQKRYK